MLNGPTDTVTTPYLKKLLDALQEAVFLIDSRRLVLQSNPAAKTLFGDSFEGEDFVKVNRHPDCISAINLVLRGEAKSRRVIALDMPSNTTYQINVASLGDSNPDGARVVVSLKDISDMREAEQMRTDFVANVSHELRSPLTAFSGFVETLRTVEDIDDDARNHFLELMDMESQRMVRLIADLLSLSKVESQQRKRPDGTADILAIINRVQTTLGDQAQKEGKTFQLSCPDVVPSVPGDEDELTQVFQNLIENAVKYGRRDSQVFIEISQSNRVPGLSGDTLVVDVRDEGEGFEQHHIPRLTERFYRVDTHRSRNKGGTGLGLAIVKHIINRHRGRFLITSEKGTGSKFTVCLPLER